MFILKMRESTKALHNQGDMLRSDDTQVLSEKILNSAKEKLIYENKSFHSKNFFQSYQSVLTSNNRNTGTTKTSKQFSLHKYDDIEHMYQKSNRLSSYNVIHTSRIRNIRKTCSNEPVFEDQVYSKNFSFQYYSSKEYNYAFCKVPKCGSTFWMRTFNILFNGLDNNEAETFNAKRKNVHQHTNKYACSFETVKHDLLRTILVSRDPYSRLYSAYVDKIFLPLLPYFILSIRTQNIERENQNSTIKCPFNISFQEFLDWLIKYGSVEDLDPHFAPIVSLCRPCEVNSFILVKQESFSEDVEFALKQIGVTGENFDHIMSALHEQKVEFSLPGIIGTVFDALSVPTVQACLSSKDVAERLWQSFKIQGYINWRTKFPEYLFNDKGDNSFSNTTYFTQVVLDTIKQRPLTSSESKKQRLDNLLNAYKGIHETTIKGIQKMFKLDFMLFGYTNQPPR